MHKDAKISFSPGTFFHHHLQWASQTYEPFWCWDNVVETKGHKDLWKLSNPCHVGINWIALAE